MTTNRDSDLWEWPPRSRMSYKEMNPFSDHDSLSLSLASGKTSLNFSKSRGKFNNASALGRSLYWCPALHIMNKDRYQSTSARRALALLNSPLICFIQLLNAPIPTKSSAFFRLLKCLRSLFSKLCGPRSDCSYRSSHTAPIEAVCSGSTLFGSILNSSVKLGNYLQQTTSADDIFRCIFFLGHLMVKFFPDYEEPWWCKTFFMLYTAKHEILPAQSK